MSEKKIFYDTDCLSCFISIDYVSILKKLFQKIIIPYEVHKEFSRINILKNRIDTLVQEGFVEVINFDTSTKTYEFFRKLCKGEVTSRKIGEGEAAAITLAIENNGILASNNTHDVQQAIEIYGIERITTGDILVKAYYCGIITKKEGNEIWKKMLNQNRYLTEKTFSKYLKKHNNIKF